MAGGNRKSPSRRKRYGHYNENRPRANPATILPLKLIDEDVCDLFRSTMAEGLSIPEAVEEAMAYLGYTSENGYKSNAIWTRRRKLERWAQSVYEDPVRWDPYLDEVAIERAMAGRLDAWLALTHYERRECLRRLYEHDQSGVPLPHWPELTAREGVLAWAHLLNESTGRVYTYGGRQRREREEALKECQQMESTSAQS